VTVAIGQAVKNVTISMVPAPAISGVVYDPFGDPLAAAVVQAYARRYTPHGPQLQALRKTLTNDLGEFRLFWLNFGEYVLGASYGDRALASALGMVRLSANVPKPDDGYVPVYYSDAMQPPQGQTIRLAPGSDTGNLTFNLHDFSRFRIRGRIIPSMPNSSIAFVPKGTDLVAPARLHLSDRMQMGNSKSAVFHRDPMSFSAKLKVCHPTSFRSRSRMKISRISRFDGTDDGGGRQPAVGRIVAIEAGRNPGTACACHSGNRAKDRDRRQSRRYLHAAGSRPRCLRHLD
jgi:hypothetical protein